MTVRSYHTRTGFWLCFALILVVALLLRVWQIDLRPLHSDEGVNFHFIQQIFDNGYYPYSHENYHGPSFFYFSALCVSVLGWSDLGLRFSAVLAGVALLLILLPLKRTEGSPFVLIAALLCAFSSSLTFYARYAIHESIFLLSGAALGVALYMWVRTWSVRYIYFGGVALAVHIATKETFIITLFCLGLATLTLASPVELWRRFRGARQHIFYALILVALLVVLLFSGGFQWAGGLREMFLAVPQWIGRNKSDTGHFKPFWYYADILIGTALRTKLTWGLGVPSSTLTRAVGAEPHLLLVLLISVAYLLSFPSRLFSEMCKPRQAFLRFSAVWALSAFVVYGFVDYKTPWLVINISFPVILFLSACLSRLFEYDWYGHWLGAICVVAAVVIALWGVWRFNFSVPYGGENPYSYVHTRQGMRDLVSDLHHYRKFHPQAKVLVGVRSYWPLPYYLREWHGVLGYIVTDNPQEHASNYQVMILDRDVRWNPPGWAKKYYRLSDVQESHTYFLRKK